MKSPKREKFFSYFFSSVEKHILSIFYQYPQTPLIDFYNSFLTLTDQIFISHSSNDHEIVDYLIDKFDDTGIKPIRMEYEKWSRKGKPNWIWIKDEIQKSKALFLILTKNIVKKEFTENWVAFEIGVASVCDPQLPVLVFREEDVDFPVPFLNHYFDQQFSKKTHLFT